MRWTPVTVLLHDGLFVRSYEFVRLHAPRLELSEKYKRASDKSLVVKTTPAAFSIWLSEVANATDD